MFKDYTLQTTWGKALVALVGGAIVGALVVMYYDITVNWTLSSDNTFKHGSGSSLQLVSFWTAIFFRYLTYVGAAIFVVGTPVWIFAHKFGFRTWLSAAFAGIVVPLVVVLSLLLVSYIANEMGEVDGWYSSDNHWVGLFLETVIFAFAGAPTALTIWRIAYRRPAPC